MKTVEDQPKPLRLNRRTRGHKRIIPRLGGPASAIVDEKEWDALTKDERFEGTLVLIWLFMQPIDDLKPGGKLDSAIEAQSWGRYFKDWEFSIADDEIPALVSELNEVLA
jgi:hypothetical protein